jgi:putative ABC transport system ATP-binding protein
MSLSTPLALLEARDVCRSYGEGTARPVHALQDVSLTITRGSFCVLTGPSGSGKSTLLALLGALDRPTRGQVLFEGRELGSCSDMELARIRRRVGFVFQDFGLIPTLKVWENLTYALLPHGLRWAERSERARSLLARFGIADRLAAYPGELSGGEKQRVAVARALAGNPELILADEPTSNLDPAAAQTLQEILQQLHGEGKTVLVSTHDAQLLTLATHTFQLEAGRLKTG